jgi:hypothetical protein
MAGQNGFASIGNQVIQDISFIFQQQVGYFMGR